MCLLLAFGGWWIASHIQHLAVGLPLDDAYIFKRYALNLASGFGFSFNPGERSLGCSSFLWAVLLSLLVKVFGEESYFQIAQSTGIFFTAASLYMVFMLVKDYTKSWLMVFAAWVLAWFSGVTFMNAVSGMESGLFSFLVLLNIYWFQKYHDKTIRGIFRMGFLAGLIFLARPEGLYFAIAIFTLLFFRIFKGGRLTFFRLGVFGFGFAIPAAPYLWWLNHHFHQFLPYTYLAKLYSSDPGLLARGLNRKFEDGLGFMLSGWDLLISPWKIVGWVLLVSALLGVVYAAIEFWRKEGNAAYALVAGWMFLPFAYGFKFPVTPHFGGYYQRYIASVWLIMILLGLLGMSKIYAELKTRAKKAGCFFGLVYLAGFIAFLIYSIPIVKGQYRQGESIYKSEVASNQGLRLQAANWLKQKTRADARVLVGYTGLGVVGGESERYVLDIGALINPDLFPYLEGTVHLSEPRWQKVLKYVCLKKLDYYVSFAPKIGPDPAKTPGFKEVARLGLKREPEQAMQQIRIYKIDLDKLCREQAPAQK